MSLTKSKGSKEYVPNEIGLSCNRCLPPPPRLRSRKSACPLSSLSQEQHNKKADRSGCADLSLILLSENSVPVCQLLRPEPLGFSPFPATPPRAESSSLTRCAVPINPVPTVPDLGQSLLLT